MSKCSGLTIFELGLDEKDIGCCIGVSDDICWKFFIYLDDEKLLRLFEKGPGISKDSIAKLNHLVSGKNYSGGDIIKFEYFHSIQSATFYKYDLNIYETPRISKIKPVDFIKTLELNLIEINSLQPGDAIMFERGLYHHAAILTDTKRMLCVHRSGEPDEIDNFQIASCSLVGLPTEKASVTEDHLIEVAGYSRLYQRNKLYDRGCPARPNEEIVIEARRRIGEKGYSITRQNCQHFVSEIRNGTAISPEVQQIANGAIATTVFGGLTIFGLLATRYFKNNSKKEIQNKNY